MLKRLAIFALALTLSANALLLCSCGGSREDATHGTEKPREEMTDTNGNNNGSGNATENGANGGIVEDIADGIGDMTDGVEGNSLPNARNFRRGSGLVGPSAR